MYIISSNSEALVVSGSSFHALTTATRKAQSRMLSSELTEQPVMLYWLSEGDSNHWHWRHNADCQQGMTVLCREGNEMPECTAGTHSHWSLQSMGLMCSDLLAEKISHAAVFTTHCNLSKKCIETSVWTRVAESTLLTTSYVWGVKERRMLQIWYTAAKHDQTVATTWKIRNHSAVDLIWCWNEHHRTSVLLQSLLNFN